MTCIKRSSLPGREPVNLLLDRRRWLQSAAGTAIGLALSAGCSRPVRRQSGDVAGAPLRFPGKVPMRVINDRPPDLETPWSFYHHDLTPNEAFFVRWHLQFIPTTIDLRTWRLRVDGHVTRELELSLDELRTMTPTSVVAVNQCAGNSRGLFEPHLPGAQWGNGGMGNARWTGVPLRDLLSRAGVKAGAVEVSFAAMDRGGYRSVPDFTKSLPVEKALSPEILIAYAMNGEPLPFLNGFPARLVVPGWYGTYWVKALTEVAVLPHRFEGFWMSKAYRIPTTPNAVEVPGKLAAQTIPVHRMNVRSFFTAPDPEAHVSTGQTCLLEGIAFDGGEGIQTVEVSSDGGVGWRKADLGSDHGRFSFRRWTLHWRPEQSGQYRLLVRATNRAGETQPMAAGWNRSGYMRNVVEALTLHVG